MSSIDSVLTINYQSIYGPDEYTIKVKINLLNIIVYLNY